MAKDYISREAAIKVVRDIINHYHECYVSNARVETAEWCLEKLKELPAADAIEERCQQVDEFAEEAARLYAKLHRWIPVTERLPKDNEAVVITWVNRNPVFYYQHIKDKPQTATGVYYKCQWYWWSAVVQDYLAEYGKWDVDKMDDAIEVTHWMPLPEPPREETK